MDDLRALCATRGVFLRREALARGYDDRALLGALRRGELVRVRHGAYAFAADWSLLDPRARHLRRAAAVLLSKGTELVPSHVTAAAALGVPLWGLSLDDVHVTRSDQRCGRRAAGVVQHRGVLAGEDLVTVSGLTVTSPARTVVDIAATSDIERGLCVANALMHARELTKADLEGAAVRAHQAPGTLGLHVLTRLATGLSESVGESRSLMMFYRHGLPRPVLQHPVLDERGHLVARLDFAWPEHGVYVEFDGRVKYEALLREGETASDVVVREKRREDAVRRLTGWRCIRITWRDLEDPVRTCRMIQEALAATAA